MIKIDIRKSKNCNEDYAMYISFDYDSYIVNTIKSLSTRFYNADNKEWEVSIRFFETLIEKFSNYDITIMNYERVNQLLDKDENAITFDNFKFKTKPFAHQIEGFNYGLNHDKWLLGDEQGLGKTKQVIDIAVAKKQLNNYKHCLIICGVNGLKWNWVNEIHTHSDEDAYILGQRTNKKGKTTIGSNKDKLADLNALESILSYFIITNVESLRDEAICSKISEICAKNDIMIATDEIHKMKNPSSQQGKAFLKLKAKTMIAMTGTPLMNNPMDLYIILKWLGYEKHSFYKFKNHYCVMGGFGGYEIVGYRYLDELQAQLNEIMLRRLKSDVLDLPDKLYIDEYVEMTAKQSQIYKEVTMDIKAHIDEIAVSPNPLAQLIRLRQATGYTGILSSSICESAKLDRMEELVDEAVENGNKVVIFSNWTQMTDVIKTRLAKKYKGTVITGQTDDAERQINVNTFQNNPDCKYIIGTIGAMGTGLTLTSGTVEIFMDEPWSRALYDQAVDRCHRVGQNSNVTIYNLLCKNTIDERIHDLVQQKGEMSDMLVDGKAVGNKLELLNYLIS